MFVFCKKRKLRKYDSQGESSKDHGMGLFGRENATKTRLAITGLVDGQNIRKRLIQ